MKTFLIVGLGNPEEKYKDTRHNLGFEIAKAYVNSRKEIFGLMKDVYFSDIVVGKSEGMKLFSGKTGSFLKRSKILVLFPLTYMNNSGDIVQKIASFYKVQPEDILVIQDDKDMEFGNIRFVGPEKDGGFGGHNGIQSIIQKLGTGKFGRLKVGVANELVLSRKIDTADFVLGKFTPEEQEQLPVIIKRAVEAIE